MKNIDEYQITQAPTSLIKLSEKHVNLYDFDIWIWSQCTFISLSENGNFDIVFLYKKHS